METYVECQSRGYTLRGMMHVPNGLTGPCPFVVIFHGLYDSRSEIGFVHTELSRRLCAIGIGSLRFDFAGNGDSDGAHEDMTVSGEAADGRAILDFVRSLSFADKARVGVHGLSLGGCVASIVAGQRPSHVAALSLWCPAPDVVYNMRNKVVCGVPVPDIEEKGYGDMESLKLGRPFYEDCLTLDPYAIAAHYKGPVNLVHGDADTVASYHCSERYKAIFGNRARLTLVHGAGHHFETVSYREARMKSAIDFFEHTLLGKESSWN